MSVAHDVDGFHITPGQRRVIQSLLGRDEGRTYAAVAVSLRISIGTVYTHLRRLRLREPELYRAIMNIRRQQLETRHAGAARRAAAHSDAWHGKQSARRHCRHFGVWPHEVKLYRQLGRLDFLEALRRSRGF